MRVTNLQPLRTYHKSSQRQCDSCCSGQRHSFFFSSSAPILFDQEVFNLIDISLQSAGFGLSKLLCIMPLGYPSARFHIISMPVPGYLASRRRISGRIPGRYNSRASSKIGLKLGIPLLQAYFCVVWFVVHSVPCRVVIRCACAMHHFSMRSELELDG
jgi:hypothetical protein